MLQTKERSKFGDVFALLYPLSVIIKAVCAVIIAFHKGH
jgi:hypothetical protein